MNKFFILFFASYNPLLIYLLMAHAGIGIMSLRLSLVLTTLVLIILFFFSVNYYKKEYRIKLPNIGCNFLLITAFLFIFILSSLWGITRNTEIKFILLDFLFFGEFFLGYYLIKFSNFSNYPINDKIKYFGIYLFLMCLLSLLSYFYLTYFSPTRINFGALKVDVDGEVFNRLVDFIIPIFAAPIIFYFTGSFLVNVLI